MIYPFLIARKENAELLSTVCKKLSISKEAQRKLIGKSWKLSEILKSLRNYSVQTHFIIDLGAVDEKDEMLISMLDGIRYQRDDAVIILFSDELSPGSTVLDKLYRGGYKNIIASTDKDNPEHNWELIFSDLEKCLTEGELPEERSVLYRLPDPEPEETEKKKSEKDKCNSVECKPASVYTYSNCDIRLNFYGASERVGTTSLTLITAQYFYNHGAEDVCVVFKSKEEARRFRLYYGINDSEPELFTYCGIHFTPNLDDSVVSQVVLCDMGVFSSEKGIADKGAMVLVAALDWMDMLNTYKAQKIIANLDENAQRQYILAVNYSSTTQLYNARKVMYHPDVPILLIPFCPDKMTLGEGQTESFDNVFAFLAD